jgi:uncharacterized Rmd1/YagE family protein
MEQESSIVSETRVLSGRTRIKARAFFIAERIDLKGLEASHRLGVSPLLISAGENGYAVLFRYGAVVLFDLKPLEEVSFLNQLNPLLSQPFSRKETEELELVLDPASEEQPANGVIHLHDFSVERLQTVADILAKSVVLAYYEASVAEVFDSIEPLAAGLQQEGKAWHRGKDLMRYIGGTLLIHQKTVGRVEVGEKPDLLWDRPELGRLYARLEDEYELRERHLGLERKLDLIGRTVETLLDILHNNRSLRVEWYIVVLIVVEICLTLYEMFYKG